MTDTSNSKKIRLNKFLTINNYVNSRRKADEMIIEGLVKVNQKKAKLGQLVSDNDIVKVNNLPIKPIFTDNKTILLNKPEGYVCSHVAQDKNKTIFSLLPKSYSSLKIAGRLDKNSCGLVVLSSDGDLINKLSHPSNKKQKIYIIKTNSQLTKANLKQLETGVQLSDGWSKFVKITPFDSKQYKIVLEQGRNRQIRRSLDALGIKVLYLQRIQLGPFFLNGLKEKMYRSISASQLNNLKGE